LGGKSVIKGTVLHHSRFIANSRVFIKFNAKEFPGTDTTKYDAKVFADAAGNYSIKCYKGDYYLFGFGFDDQLSLNVKGGVGVHIRNNESISIDVPVTE
jgi:hypothetical protein